MVGRKALEGAMSDRFAFEDSEDEDIDAQLAREFGTNTNHQRPTTTRHGARLADMTGLVEPGIKPVRAKNLDDRHHGAKQKAVSLFVKKRLLRNDNPDLFHMRGEVLVCLLDAVNNDEDAEAAIGGFISVIYKSGGHYYALVDTYD
jgi:hypothetical protein